MPYQFEYRINNTDHLFRCNINSVQCEANTKTGARCSRLCAIGTPFCYSHLLSEKKLRIKASVYGKGLFAQLSNRSAPADEIVFAPGETIIEYTGDSIDLATLNERYDLNPNQQYTAPYAYGITADSFIDAACNRGIGSLVNHKGMSRANAKFVKIKNANNVPIGVRLRATKNIRNNREIFAPYGSVYRFREPTTHRTTYRNR